MTHSSGSPERRRTRSLVALGFLVSLAFGAVPARARPAQLDADFGVGGSTGIPGLAAQFEGDLTLDRTGRVVLAASCEDERDPDAIASLCVARLDTQGLPDMAFGAQGVTRIGHVDGASFMFWTNPSIDVIVDSADRIVVAASCDRLGDSSSADFCFARFTDDGRPDPDFGGEHGIAGFTMPQLPLYQSAYWITELPDGRYLAMGHCSSAFCAVRLETDGSIDPTYGDGSYQPGVVKMKYGQYDLPATAIVDSEQRLVVVGGCQLTDDFASNAGCMTRLTPQGRPDPDFGSEGSLHFGDVGIGRLTSIREASGEYLVGTTCSTVDPLCHLRIPTQGPVSSATAAQPLSFMGPEGVGAEVIDIRLEAGVTVLDALCGREAFCTITDDGRGMIEYSEDWPICEAIEGVNADGATYRLRACPQDGFFSTLVVSKRASPATAPPTTTTTTTTTTSQPPIESSSVPTTDTPPTTTIASSSPVPVPSEPEAVTTSSDDGGATFGIVLVVVLVAVAALAAGVVIGRRRSSATVGRDD